LLNLILAESSLETVPKLLWDDPLIVKYSKLKGKHSKFVLLDRSYHHFAMLRLEEGEKRGRPDIVHRSLLMALDSPLNREGLLGVVVHTLNDYVVTIQPETRLPRNYNRFVGLMEQLFQLGNVPATGKALLRLEQMTFGVLIERLKPDRIVGFSQEGVPRTIEKTVSGLRDSENVCIVIGGFPHRSFSQETETLFDEKISIDREGLDASTVVSRVIYEYEKARNLTEKRLLKV